MGKDLPLACDLGLLQPKKSPAEKRGQVSFIRGGASLIRTSGGYPTLALARAAAGRRAARIAPGTIYAKLRRRGQYQRKTSELIMTAIRHLVLALAAFAALAFAALSATSVPAQSKEIDLSSPRPAHARNQ